MHFQAAARGSNGGDQLCSDVLSNNNSRFMAKALHNVVEVSKFIITFQPLPMTINYIRLPKSAAE